VSISKLSELIELSKYERQLIEGLPEADAKRLINTVVAIGRVVSKLSR